MDIDTALTNINGTSTPSRKTGIQTLLELIKSYYHYDDDNDENDDNSNIKDLFENPVKLDDLFTALSWLLRDSTEPEIQRNAVETLIAIITKNLIPDKLDIYIHRIFKYLLVCFNAPIMSVRKSANQCFHEYLNKTSDFNETINSYIELTLNRNDLSFNQRRDYNQTLQIVLTRNFADKSFDGIIGGVLKQIESPETEDKVIQLVLGVLRHIRKVFGDEKVVQSVHNLSVEYQTLYFDNCHENLDHKTTPSVLNGRENGYNLSNSSLMQSKSFSLSSIPITAKLYCGFIPETTYDSLQDGERRLESVEELSGLFNGVKMDKRVDDVVLPHLKELFGIIRKLMMSDQYNVIIKTLTFLIDMIQACPDTSLTEHVVVLVELLRISLTNNMNTDAIVQKLIASYSNVLFKKLDSMVLMRRLCENQFINDQKQSIRWMSINIIISALLEFPSNKFDLNFITMKVVHRLLDKRPKVKQAALECMAVLGSYLGPSPMSQMMKWVEQTIISPDQLDLIKRQIHQRLTLHKLPHRNDNGIIVYALDYDKFMKHIVNSSRNSSVQGVYSDQNNNNSSSDNSPVTSANILEKRRPSAGTIRGRAKLPWDNSESPNSSSKPFSKASASNSNYSKPSESSGTPIMQYSQFPLTINHPSEYNSARNMKKYSELKSGNELEIASSSSSPSSAASSSSMSSNRMYGGGSGFGRNSKFDNNNMTSLQTSGYNSGSTTVRQNQFPHKSDSPKDDCPTATNSTTTTPRNANNNCLNRSDDPDFSPIPTKPALARSAGNKRRELENSRSNKVTNEVISVVPTESQIKVEHIRNSASKKKAQKIFNSNQSATSSPDSVSPRSFNSQISLDSIKGMSVLKHQSNNHDNIVPSGIIGRSVNSEGMETNNKNKPVKGMLDTTNNGQQSNRTSQSTFKNNNIGSTSTETSKRPSEQILRSSLSESALKTTPSRFLNPSNNNQSKDISNSSNESSSRENRELNNGIRGVAINHDNTDSDEEIPHNVRMSNTLRESVSLKRLKQGFGESQSSINTDYSMSHSAPGTAKNRVKPPIGVNTIPGVNSNSHAGSSAASVPSSASNERTENSIPPSRKPLRPVYGVKKSKSNMTNLNSSDSRPAAAWTSEPNVTGPSQNGSSQPSPLPNPDKAIPQSLSLIRHEDWEDKMEALTLFQSLVIYHTDILLSKPPDLHAICLAITREIMNLRSQVARMGIQTAGYFFKHLKKAIDSELDQIVKALFSRASDQSVGFIRQDVEATLMLLIDNVSPNRLISAMVHNYINNKNVGLRRMAAANLMYMCERLSHSKFLSIIKDMNDKVILTIVKFTTDSNVETRYFGRRIIYELMKNGEFDKICHRVLPESDLRHLQTVIDNIKCKGIGDPPKLTQSAGLGRTHSMSRGNSANNPASQPPGAQIPSAPAPSLSRRSSRSMTRLPTSSINNDSTLPNDSSSLSPTNWIATTCDQLKSPDFRQRLQGIDSLLEHTELPASQQHFLTVPPKTLNRLIIELIPTLKDNNSRVAIASLHLTQKFLPCIRSNFPNEHLSRLVNCIAHGFSSKSPDIRQQSLSLMHVIFETIDPVPLIQPCIESINNANKATKPSLVDNFSTLLTIQQQQSSSTQQSTRLSNALVRHIVPFISHLIENVKPFSNNLRDSIQHLIQMTYEIVGPELLEQAGQRGGPKLKQCFAEFVK